MCGLGGFIGYENNEALAKKANAVQKHRGPDNQTVWSDGHIALMHQRLSIIDLSDRANQPFHKYNLVIIFNGEIYNYKELKENLLTLKKVEFKSDSDTEIILEYFALFQEKCLSHFIGMFSFSIYNKDTKELFIARDHFGIKPLFYTKSDQTFAFSSELKSLLVLPDFDFTINDKALVSSLNYLWVSGNESMFANCYKLPPAHYLRVDESLTVKITRYWSLSEENIDQREQAVMERLTREVEETVARHMVADVPVSAFLSGGLDSSLISVLAARHNSRLSTYTIGTSQKDKMIEQMPEDEKYAKKLADLHQFDHHEIVISSDIVKLLPKMVRALDEPIGDPAAINTFLICEAAKKRGVKVLLSGMGADEFFGGYRRHKATLLSLRYQRLPGFLRSVIERVTSKLPVKIGAKGIRLTRWAKRFLSFASLPVEKAYMTSYSYYTQEELQNLFKGEKREAIGQLYQEHERIFNSKYQGDVVNQMCHTDMHMFLLGLNLTYSDRASMAASVEIRVPFVDRNLINYAMNIPGKLKIRKGESKYILKKVAEKYLPHEIIYRPKAAFSAPIRSWISHELKPLVDELLSEESVGQRNLFDYKMIQKIIEDDRKGTADNAYRIYQLLTLELWFREYIDNNRIYEASNTELQNR